MFLYNKVKIVIDDEDTFGKWKLVCKGSPPEVKCHWERINE